MSTFFDLSIDRQPTHTSSNSAPQNSTCLTTAAFCLSEKSVHLKVCACLEATGLDHVHHCPKLAQIVLYQGAGQANQHLRLSHLVHRLSPVVHVHIRINCVIDPMLVSRAVATYLGLGRLSYLNLEPPDDTDFRRKLQVNWALFGFHTPQHTSPPRIAAAAVGWAYSSTG